MGTWQSQNQIPRYGETSTLCYILLSAVYLLTFGVFNTSELSFQHEWHIGVLIASLVCLVWEYSRSRKNASAGTFGKIIFAYAVIIVLSALFHHSALESLAADTIVNTTRDSAGEWLHRNLRFSVHYLFFPALLALGTFALKDKNPLWLCRVLAIFLTLSLLAVFFQAFSDPFFVNRHYWVTHNRFGGLASDPNAFALTAYLALPLLFGAVILEQTKLLRILYCILGLGLIPGLYLTGNRTAFIGMLLLLVLCPLVIAVSVKNVPSKWKKYLFGFPFAVVIASICLFFSHLSFQDRSLGARLIETVQKFQHGGIRQVFFEDEARGKTFESSLALIKKAPLGGWGPGGFYREYPNESYRSTGLFTRAYDSSLNHYLMIAGDLGFPAFFLNLLLIIYPLITAAKRLKTISDPLRACSLASLLVANTIFLLMILTLPPSYFPDVLWVWTAELALLSFLSAETTGCSLKRKQTSGPLLALLVLFGAFGSFETSFGQLGYSARETSSWWPFRYSSNCWDVEQWPEGKVAWCSKNALLSYRLRFRQQDALRVKIKATHPDIAENPVTVRYGGKKGVDLELILSDTDWHEIELELNSGHVYIPRVPKSAINRFAVVSLDVSRTWSPKDFGLNNDERQLGVAVLVREKWRRK